MKLLRKTAILLIAVCVLTGSRIPVYAVDQARAQEIMEKREQTGEEDLTDVAAWYQGRVPFDDHRLLAEGTSGTTVGRGGCSYFAAAYMLLKMGQLDLLGGETPLTVLDRMEEIGGYLDFGKMDYERIGEVWPDVSCLTYKMELYGSNEEKIQVIKYALDKGCYVIATVAGGVTSGHYIFIDEVLEDGDMVIGDSAHEGTRWSDTFGPAGTDIVDISLFVCEGTESYNMPSIYDYKEFLESGEPVTLKAVPVED